MEPASRRTFFVHLLLSAFVGFLGFIHGGMVVNHKCYADIPIWRVSIVIFSAVSFGYSWYKIPRWYFRLPTIVVLFFVVWALADVYIRAVHRGSSLEP
jgi:hypothetical protein